MRLLDSFKEAMAVAKLGRGSYSLQRYQVTGQIGYLSEALEHLQKAVAQCPAAGKNRSACVTALGVALREQYSRTGDVADLDGTIEAWDEALRLAPLDSPNRPGALNNVGIGLYERYCRRGNLADLDRAIKFYKDAVNALPAGSEGRKSILNNLGSALRVHYGQSGDTGDLVRATRAHEEAVQLSPTGSTDLHTFLNNLGDDLRASYNGSGNLEELNRAVNAYEQALQGCPTEAPIRPMYLSNFGTALRLRHAANGSDADLERAIEALSQAVKQSPPDALTRTVYLNNLGAGLVARYCRNGKPADLNRAVEVLEEAVQRSPAGAPDGVGGRSTLGLALTERYGYSGNPADLERAIQVYEDALQLLPPLGPDRLFCLNNLGAAFRARFNASGDLADLEKAIDSYREAIQKSLPGAPVFSACLANLGTALRVRYDRLSDPADLQESIDAFNNAVAQVPPNSPELPTYLNDLANSWLTRYSYTGDVADLDKVIAFSGIAVQQSMPGVPFFSICLSTLGSALRERYHRRNDPADLEHAIEVHQEALNQTPSGSPNRTSFLNSVANDLSDRYDSGGNLADQKQSVEFYEEACREGMRMDVAAALMAASNWGNWALKRNAWEESARAYTFGLDARDLLFSTQLLRASKESWLREAGNLAARAAYALAQTGQLRRAAEVLEHGHARFLSLTLERDRTELEKLHELAPEIYSQYAAAANRLQALEAEDVTGRPMSSILLSAEPVAAGESILPRLPPSRILSDLIRQCISDIDDAVKAIREVPNYARFLMPLTFDEIRLSARNGPLVFFAVAPVGGLALIVLPAKTEEVSGNETDAAITFVPLPELSEQSLKERLIKPDGTVPGGYLDSYLQWKANDQASAGWHSALDETTRWLWDAAMGPLLQVLVKHGATSATLIPQGLLGLLPLVAAWTEDVAKPTGRSYALDAIAFNYAPNGRALTACQDIAARTAPDSLLAVANPQPLTLAESLPNAAAEVMAAASTFAAAAVLDGEDATREALLAYLQLNDAVHSTGVVVPSTRYPANVWHFSCHGQARPVQPLESGLLLAGDEWLTVRDLFALRLSGVRLAVLSACETGISGTRLPDEMIGLPTGLVQAGVAGVVASLWSVDEISTALLLVRFYALWRGEAMAAEKALQQAQIWLRDTANEEKAEYFKISLPEFSQAATSAAISYKLPTEVAEVLFQDSILRPLGLRDFSHPYYWAAFQLTGV
jgi:CHAT domain-containing protein